LPFLLLFACSSAAHAHVGLATTVPDHDALLEQAPTLLHFEFKTTVMITNARLEYVSTERMGERIDIRLPRDGIGQSTAIGDMVDLELPELEPATYKVVWQAVSRDGEILVDDFNFTVLPLVAP
jgi:methionine-rich copper-binding protein CopC